MVDIRYSLGFSPQDLQIRYELLGFEAAILGKATAA